MAGVISHAHRCIFVHIPKTGGTSVEDILWPRPRKEADLWMGLDRNKYQTGGLQHLFARHIRQEVGNVVFAAYFKFAFVRDPWEKAVSQFAYLARRADLRDYLELGPDPEFKTYLERTRRKSHVQWDEQHRFVFDEHGELLVDYLGRFEHFERHFREVLSRLQVSAGAIPHSNRGSHGPFEKYYDAESIGMVAAHYARDCKLFGYNPPSLSV